MYGTTPTVNRATRYVCIICGVAILASELAHPADHVHVHMTPPDYQVFQQQIFASTSAPSSSFGSMQDFLDQYFKRR